MPIIIDDVEIPDDIVDMALCEQDRGSSNNPDLINWVDLNILPLVKRELKNDNLRACAHHVNLSNTGVRPHDHAPYLFTSILYLMDSDGDLVVQAYGHEMTISPEMGRLVIIPGEMIHSVEPSTQSLRISLVVSYE